MEGGTMAGPESQNSLRRIKAAERQLEALNLRRAGMGYQEIARQLGYKGPNGSWHAVHAALRRAVREPADAVRKVELSRLDALLAAIWDKATLQADGESIDRCLRIMRRRSELLGLDAPKNMKLQHSGQVAVMDWDSLVRAVPAEELRDKIADKLEAIAAGKPQCNETNGQA
jgi:hypothetical protein